MDEVDGRICSRCDLFKFWKYFDKSKNGLNGYSSWCKSCHSIYCKMDRKRNPKKFKRQNRIARVRNYGLTPTDYDDMVEFQDGICAICGNPPKGKRGLDIDHDHLSGVVRGLLCTPCNTNLRVFENPPCENWLEVAQEYLYGD